MRLVFVAACLCAAFPAVAQELPQFPKSGPPDSLPEPVCDTTRADGGDWLLGHWVSPHSRWEFHRQDGALHWVLERKGSVNDTLGWDEGARLDGAVTAVSPCSFTLDGGNGQFVMNAVLTDGGKVFGVAVNPKGDSVRFLLRRER